MLRRLGLFVFLLAALSVSRADTLHFPNQFPFHYTDGLLCVNVELLPGKEQLRFLVDSGASTSILNLAAAQKVGIKLGKKTTIIGTKATTDAHWSPQLAVNIGDGTITQKFLIADLQAISGMGEKVDGLIGADFFAGRVVEINFVSETIRVLNNRPLETQSWIPLKITSEGTFLIAARVNRNPSQWFRLDTGCSSSLHWTPCCAGLTRHSPETSIALATRAVRQTFSSFETGGVVLQAVPTALQSTPLFGGEAGLVGNGLLSRFGSIVIDGKSARLFLGKQRQAG
jgi:predicted aspartyl protease